MVPRGSEAPLAVCRQGRGRSGPWPLEDLRSLGATILGAHGRRWPIEVRWGVLAIGGQDLVWRPARARADAPARRVELARWVVRDDRNEAPIRVRVSCDRGRGLLPRRGSMI